MLDVLSQSKTPEEAIGKLQEGIFGYLQVAFAGEFTKGLVLAASPLTHRLRYRAHHILARLVSVLKRQHAKHLLRTAGEHNNIRFSHC